MKKTTKRICFTMLLMIALFSFIGCGNKEQGEKTETGKEAEIGKETGKEIGKEEVEEKVEEKAATIQVFIANSLNDAMIELVDMYNEEKPNTTITLNSLGSQELREQIEGGIECDLFISASMSHMTALDENKEVDYITDDTIVKLLGNELVLIKAKGQESKVSGFENIGECTGVFALAGEEVPVGNYSRQAFEALGITEAVFGLTIDEKTKVGDVKSAVIEGLAEIGTVYKSDTYSSVDKLDIIATANPEWFEKPIVYPIGCINNEKATEEQVIATKDFYEFLQSEEAMKIFEKYMFVSYKE